MKKRTRPQESNPKVQSVAAHSSLAWWPWAAAAAALVVVFQIYGPALNGAFVFDDLSLPWVANPNDSTFAIIRSLRPLLLLSFWADNRLAGGSDPFWFHATNVFLHIGASVFVTLISAKLFEWAGVSGRLRAAVAIFCGGLFLLHPIQTESVSYVASRSENLSVMFYYAAFTVFLYRPGATMTWLRALAIFALFGAAISTKEHALTLPVLLVLADYFWNRGGIRANRTVYLLLVVAGAAGSVLVWNVLRGADTAGFGVKGLTPAAYFFTQCRVIWTYLRMFVWPSGQNIDPDVAISNSLLDHGAIFGLIGLIALVAAACIFRKRYPLASFGVFTLLLLIAPTSSFIPIRDVQAEHRLYLPFLGLVLICAEVLRRLQFKQMMSVGAAVLALCCVLTYRRNAVWATPLDLWTDSVSKSPNKYRPRFQLAYAEYLDGQCEAASQNFNSASHMATPDNVLLTDWALALDCAGHWQDAIQKLTQAEAFVNDAHVHTQLAMVYAKHNQMPAATAELDAAQKLDPGYDIIYVYRGNIALIAGDRAGAESEFRHALALNPSDQAARDGLVKATAR